MKIMIRVTRNVEEPDYGPAQVEVFAQDKAIVNGTIGGEPEDNNITRDGAWIVPALKAVAKACGAEIEQQDRVGEEG